MVIRFPAFSLFFGVPHYFSLFLFGVVWFHTRVPLGPGMPGIVLLYDVLYTWTCIYSYRVLLPLLLLLCTGVVGAAAACCCSSSCAGWPKIVTGSLNLIPSSVFFLSFKHDLFLMYLPLGSTVAFTASICLYYILGNYGHGRSQGRRQPAAAKPRLQTL